LEDLFGPLSEVMDLGLARVRAALASVGAPEEAFPSVHIAGTNGKGSTAAILSSVMRTDGRTVGLYTSPHLRRFSERIRIDGLPASDALLRSAAAVVKPAIHAVDATYFEAATILAFEAFRQQGVELAVVEAGLGGRLDATNVLTPIVTAITNIGRDHTEWLGEGISEIATEKGGIVKPGVSLVTTVSQVEALEVLEAICSERNAPFVPIDAREIHVSESADGVRLSLGLREGGLVGARIPLPGAHQGVNAALALRVADLFPEYLRPAAEAAVQGCAAVRWPGRLQIVDIAGTTCVFDAAHNPAGLNSLLSALESLELPGPLVALAGILADKDWSAMVPELMGATSSLVLTTPPSVDAARAWDPVMVARTLGSPPELFAERELEAAIPLGLRLAEGGTLLITGSSYTVGAAMGLLGIDTDAGG